MVSNVVELWHIAVGLCKCESMWKIVDLVPPSVFSWNSQNIFGVKSEIMIISKEQNIYRFEPFVSHLLRKTCESKGGKGLSIYLYKMSW